MGKFNLSHWAIRHPQLITFLILAIAMGGAFAYQRIRPEAKVARH